MQSMTYKFYQGKHERTIANLGLHKLEIGDLVYIPGIGRGADCPHFTMVVKSLAECPPTPNIRVNIKVLCQWFNQEGRLKERWFYFEWLRKPKNNLTKSSTLNSPQLKLGDLVYLKSDRYCRVDQLGNLDLTPSLQAKQMLVTYLRPKSKKPSSGLKKVETKLVAKCLMISLEKEKIFEENFFVEGLELVTDIPYKRLGSQY